MTQKTIISCAWSEVFKYLATRQSHPKMFLDSDYKYGIYLKYVYLFSLQIGNKFNPELLEKHKEAYRGFNSVITIKECLNYMKPYFDELYLMSDCVSLHYKGCNVGEIIYGVEKWRRIVPIEGLKEIQRVATKTLEK